MSLVDDLFAQIDTLQAELALYKAAFELSIAGGREESRMGWGDRTVRSYVGSETLRNRYLTKAQEDVK